MSDDRCIWCKRRFERAAMGRRRIFCSEACGQKEYYRRQRDARLKAKLAKLEAAGCLDLKCRQCGKEYRPNWAKQGQAPVYCSEACKWVYWARTRKAEYSKAVGA